MDKPKKGAVCAAKDCKNKQYNTIKSFFRFPSDPNMARVWVLESHREDLLKHDLGRLHKGYRICSDHFATNMFKNDSRKRLKKNAVPTLFPTPEGGSRGHVDHSYSRPRLLHEPIVMQDLQRTFPPKINVLEEIIIIPEPLSSDEQLELDIPSSPILSPDFQSPSSTQTSHNLTCSISRKRKYKQTIKSLSNQNATQKQYIQELKDKLKNFEDNISLQQFQVLTSKFCSVPEKHTFVDRKVSQAKRRRYSDEYKIECLAMFFTGPELYKNYLMKQFCLPGPRTLLKLIEGINVRPGLNKQIFDMLKLKVDCFSELNKHCILCIDEKSIKTFYNRGNDIMEGLAENNHGDKMFKSLQASVLMLRGISSNWKQPLAYFFCHSCNSAQFLKDILLEVIQKLQAIGLKLCAVTTDMGSNNIQLARLLGVNFDQPSFVMEGEEIVYIYDVPHILKAIRNMLLKYDFLVDGQKISWKFIKMFYDHDKTYPTHIRAAPKLSDSHINPTSFEKTKVIFASQIFSATVSAGMNVYIRFGYLPTEAAKTAEFLDVMDKLFDLLNSSSTSSSKKFNRAFKGLGYQITFLKRCLEFFNRLEVRDTNDINITNKIKCFKSLRTSIHSLFSLWDNLKNANFDYLCTRRLNQDCLENLFRSIRQQNSNCVNPTPIQFQRTFKKLVCLNLLYSGIENCEADPDPILLKLKKVPLEKVVLRSQ